MAKYKFSDARRAEVAASRRAFFKKHDVNCPVDQPVFRKPWNDREARRYSDTVAYAVAMGRKQGLLAALNMSEWYATATWVEDGRACVDFQRYRTVGGRSSERHETFGPMIQVHLRFLDWALEEPVEEIEAPTQGAPSIPAFTLNPESHHG